MPHQNDFVDYVSLVVQAMSREWELPDDLLGGTPRMRERADTWLPRRKHEDADAYALRLAGSFLHPAYKDTVDKLTSRPFSRAISLREAERLGDELSRIEDDADGLGNNLTVFARAVFCEALHRGLTHVLVDVPATGGATRLDQERQADVRPYLVHLSPANVLGWRTVGTGKAEQLVQVRWAEERVEPLGSYRDELVRYVHVLTARGADPEMATGRYQKFRQSTATTNDAGWDVVMDEPYSYPGEGLPLRTLYFRRTGFMLGEPVLKDLAWTNLEHWQSASQQRHILAFSRQAVLFVRGISEKEMDHFKLSPATFLKSTNPEASAEYVEHSGAAIAAGERDLDRIEGRMEVLGVQPMMERTGNQTATARAMDESKTSNNLQAWARITEDFLVDLYHVAAEWTPGETVPEDFGVDIFNDFGVSLRASEEIQQLMQARTSGEITSRTFLSELKRRGVLGESVDVDDEIEAAANDVPLGMVVAQAMTDEQEQEPEDDDGDDQEGRDVA